MSLNLGRENFLEDIHPNEPVFVIRAKDKAAVGALKAYALEAARAGADQELTDSVHEHIERMIEWQAHFGTKTPDLA